MPIENLESGEVVINCSNCETPCKVDGASVQMSNLATVSMLLWTHRIFECPRCKYKLVGMIVGFKPEAIAFTWAAVKPVEEQSLIETATADILDKLPKVDETKKKRFM